MLCEVRQHDAQIIEAEKEAETIQVQLFFCFHGYYR